MLLEQLEEVLYFDATVFGHVRAVNGVPNSVFAESGSYRLGAQVSSDFRVMRSTQLPKSGHSILLAHFKSNNRST